MVDVGFLPVVDVIAPSSIGKRSNLAAYAKFVRDMDMTAHISDSMFREGADPFYANTDRFRADDLADALTDNSAVVWCARGGQGASRLIPFLEALPDDRKRRIRDARKTFVGYSDITILHAYLQNVYGWQTIHGTMLEQIADGAVDGRSVTELIGLVTGRIHQVRYELQRIDGKSSGPPDGPQEAQPSVRSRVVGGNLTLVENAIGTVCRLTGTGKIVFLEDINVQPYSLERSLDHLRQVDGTLDGAAAVVFGSFTKSEPVDLLDLVFRRFAAAVPYPVFRVHGIGHGFANNPLPLNTDAIVESCITTDGHLSYTLTVDNIYAARSLGGQRIIKTGTLTS